MVGPVWDLQRTGPAAIIDNTRDLYAMEKLYRLPLSGEIIGEIFRAQRIPYPALLKKEIQRYFRGERIDDKNREEIIYTLVGGLLEGGVLAYSEIFRTAFVCEWAFKYQMVRGILNYASRWDSTVAKMRCWAIPDAQREDILVSCLRLATVDLALRLSAYRHLSKQTIPAPTIPLWAKRGGSAIYLNHLLKACDGTLSNVELASSVGVENAKTVEKWFEQGSRPSRDHVCALAQEIGHRIPGGDPEILLGQMNRHYAFAGICEKLSHNIGWDRVMEMVGALFHNTARLQQRFAEDRKPVEENYSHYLVQLIFGVGSTTSYRYIDHLLETEHDPEWKQDIVCAKSDWFSRLVQRNLTFTGECILGRGEGWSGDCLHLEYVSTSFLQHQIDCDVDVRSGADPSAYEWEEAFENELRHFIGTHPDSAQGHLALGSYLGANSWFSEKIEEGLRKCGKAAELSPDWELPRIQVANILMRIGSSNESLRYLKIARQELPEMTPLLAYTIGFAKMMNNDIEGALVMFEEITEMKPDHALAWDNAAYCAFQMEDTLKGKRYARSAHQLGISIVYDRYDVGKKKVQSDLLSQRSLCDSVPCLDFSCPERSKPLNWI